MFKNSVLAQEVVDREGGNDFFQWLTTPFFQTLPTKHQNLVCVQVCARVNRNNSFIFSIILSSRASSRQEKDDVVLSRRTGCLSPHPARQLLLSLLLDGGEVRGWHVLWTQHDPTDNIGQHCLGRFSILDGARCHANKEINKSRCQWLRFGLFPPAGRENFFLVASFVPSNKK